MAKKPRIKLPKTAKKNDVINIKTLIAHEMETGFRKNKKTGKMIPRNIINKFICRFNGKQIVSADLFPGVSQNPYLSFAVRVKQSGTFDFEWHDDKGGVAKASRSISVA